MQSAQQSSNPILIEGANALMLDIDFGTYPYVTSVSPSDILYIFIWLAIHSNERNASVLTFLV